MLAGAIGQPDQGRGGEQDVEGQEVGFHPPGGAASPQEGDQQAGKERKEGERGGYIEDMFARVFEESVEDTSETLKETSEAPNRARARKAEAVRQRGGGA